MSNPDMFDETLNQEPQDFKAALVGEEAKYKTEEEAFKGLYNAQKHIKNLEEQIAQQAEDLQKRATIEEMYEKLKTTANTPAPVAAPNPAPKSDNISLDVINNVVAERMEAVLAEQQAKSTQEANKTKVASAMLDRYGNADTARKVYAEKAAELGMTVDELNALALTKPQAALRLLLPEGSTSSGVKAPTSMSNERGGNVQKETGYGSDEYWNKMRKERPNEYFSPKVQAEVMRTKHARAQQR